MLPTYHLPTELIQAGVLNLVDTEAIQHICRRLQTFCHSCLSAVLAISNCRERQAHRCCQVEQKEISSKPENSRDVSLFKPQNKRTTGRLSECTVIFYLTHADELCSKARQRLKHTSCLWTVSRKSFTDNQSRIITSLFN